MSEITMLILKRAEMMIRKYLCEKDAEVKNYTRGQIDGLLEAARLTGNKTDIFTWDIEGIYINYRNEPVIKITRRK